MRHNKKVRNLQFYRIQLHFDPKMPDGLLGLNEGSSDIVVANQAELKRNLGVVRITQGSGDTRVSVDVIAAQLLRDQYILTALEFHTELLEAGRELPRLRDYFSNPGNFERQSGTPPASKDQALGPGGPLSK